MGISKLSMQNYRLNIINEIETFEIWKMYDIEENWGCIVVLSANFRLHQKISMT